MSGGSTYGPVERVVEGLYAFLTSDADDPPAAPGYNDVLGAWRTSRSLTSTDIEDVATWERWYYRGDRSTTFPYGCVYATGVSPYPDNDGEDRLFLVNATVVVVFLAGALAEPAARRLATWYGDRFVDLFARSVTWPDGAPQAPVGYDAQSLNGFDGERIRGIPRVSYDVGDDQALTAAKRPNGAVVVQLDVVTAEF